MIKPKINNMKENEMKEKNYNEDNCNNNVKYIINKLNLLLNLNK